MEANDFIYMTVALSNCKTVQFKIDAMRAANPANSALQLKLDRQQSVLDEKLAGLQEVIARVATNN